MQQQDNPERLIVLIFFLFIITAAIFVGGAFNKLINLF